MNIIKLIRPVMQPVKLIRTTGATVKLIRPEAAPIKLVNEKGVVYLGGASDAAKITLQTNLSTYYNLQKQL